MTKAVVVAVLALTGCAAATTPPAGNAESAGGAGTVASDTCKAATVQDLVGTTFTNAVTATVQTRTGARAVRVIRPGDAVTMDYREDRLNIELDEKGSARTIRCG